MLRQSILLCRQFLIGQQLQRDDFVVQRLKEREKVLAPVCARLDGADMHFALHVFEPCQSQQFRKASTE